MQNAANRVIAVIGEPVTALRDRLLALRVVALQQLAAANHLDAGLIALAGNVGAALVAIDNAGDQLTSDVNCAPRAERVVIGDDGVRLVLALYTSADAVATVAIEPGYALHLARRLIEAAESRLR